MTIQAFGQQRMLRDALDHLQAALDLLDSAGAPAQIGANVDLAMHQLESAVAECDAEIAGVQRLARQ